MVFIYIFICNLTLSLLLVINYCYYSLIKKFLAFCWKDKCFSYISIFHLIYEIKTLLKI